MSEMVKRVADAIFNDPAWDGIRENAVSQARAAIEAMRDPTDGQRKAYYELSHKTETMVDAHWERAVDAILK